MMKPTKLAVEVVRSHNPELVAQFESISNARFQDEIEEMIAVAARPKKAAPPTPEDEDRISYTNNRSAALAKVLHPVKLDDADYREYNTVFFPKSKTDVLESLDFIAQGSRYLRGATGFLRYLIENASWLNSDYRPWEERVHQFADSFFSGKASGMAYVDSLAVSADDSETLVRSFLTPDRAASGKTHLIQPSHFFTNGIDFIVTGTKTLAAGGGAGMYAKGNGDTLPMNMFITEDQMKSSDKYLNTYAGKYTQQVFNAYKELLGILFGENEWKNYAFTTGFSPTRTSFNFQSIQSRLETVLGCSLPHLAKLLPKPLPGNTRSNYFNMAFTANPQGPWMTQAPTDPEKFQVRKESMCELYKMLGFSVGVCPVYSLPPKFAEYVCQIQSSEQYSYSSLNQWFTIWSRQLLVPKKSKGVVGGRLKPMDIPRYVLPLSKALAATQARKDLQMYTEPGRTDDHGFYINRRGLPEVMPRSDQRDNVVVAAEYEKAVENNLRAVFEAGLPADAAAHAIQGMQRKLLQGSGKDISEEHNQALQTLKKTFSGSTLYYDWDTNLHYTVHGDEPLSVRSRSLDGSARPTQTVIADYLGYDFARPGEKPIKKMAFETLYLINPVATNKSKSPEEMMLPQNLFNTDNSFSPFTMVVYAYCYLSSIGAVTGIADVINLAIQELGIKWAKDDQDDPNDQFAMFGNLISQERVPNIGPNYQMTLDTAAWLLELLRVTFAESEARRGTVTERNLRRASSAGGGSFYDLLEDLPYAFNFNSDTLGDMKKTHNLVGGAIFRIISELVAGANPKALFGMNEEARDAFNPARIYPAIPSNTLSTFVLPHAVLFGKYVPNRDTIFANADQSIESTLPDESVTEDDVKLAGAKEGSMLFPHQVKCHKTLRRHPEFALLDVAPGGGKTSLGITDISAMLEEIQDKHFRPLVICPDGLIPNWCNDARLFLGNKWNMIPLNSEIYARWGEDKLTEIIRNAPRNTILVAGIHFLNPRKDRYYVGGGVVTVSPTLEFIKQFEPNYIGIDESHWFKNPLSSRTALMRSLTTASHVQYLRLFTGTFIANRVDDALGQTSLFNAAALREEDIFGNKELQDAGSANSPDTVKEGARRARRKLSQHAAVIRATRKEWAFLLAQPIERFITVDLDYEEGDPSVSARDVELSKLHDSLYSVVLERSIEEIEKLVKEAKRSKADNEDDDDEGSGKGGDDEGDSLGLEDDDPLSALTAEQLKPYLQRIERLITSPEKDPLFEEIFGAAGVTSYVPRKVREIYELIHEHFNPPAWSKGERYSELTLVSHNAKLYLSRKLDLKSPSPLKLSESTVGIAPDQLTDVWREEPEGKVIVFCRYKDTVDTIYDNLPEGLKRMAVPFHGSVKNAKANLHLFKNDPKIKILIANEQSIKEGHNMQMASRIIRVEWPWTPGDLEQSKSRILRPDVKGNKDMIKNGKAGELYREAIFLDWVIANRTMDVNKQARLVWKTVEKAYFDEENPDNLKELDEFELEPVRLTLDALASRTNVINPSTGSITGGPLAEYYMAYNTVNGINRREFHEMRIKERPSMRMLPTGPGTQLPQDAGKIMVPFVAGQEIDDENNYGLIDAATYVQQAGNEEYVENPRNLLEKPVMTDRGPGIITSVNPRYVMSGVGKNRMKDDLGNFVVDTLDPISSIAVTLAGTDEVVRFKSASLVFIADNVDAKTVKTVFQKNKAPKISREDDAEDTRQRQKAEREARDRELKERQDRLRADVEKDNRQQGKTRKENVASGKPINANVVSRVQKVDKIKPEDRAIKKLNSEPDRMVELHPAVYHSYLVLEMETSDADSKDLKKLKFRESGEYAFVTVDSYPRFEKLLDYLEANFHMSPQTTKRLEVIQDAFEMSKKGPYQSELAPASTMPYFFNISKRLVTDKKEVRAYPIILPDELMIAIDVATCPAIRKHIGKAVPGIGQKWTLSQGNTMFFAVNKAALIAKVKEVEKAGFTISNAKQLEKEIANLKFRAPRSRS